MRYPAISLSVLLAAIATASAQTLDSPDGFGLPGFEPAQTFLTASAVASHTTVAPGQRFHLAVEIAIADGWAYYSPLPGKVAKPGQVTVQAEGLTAAEVLWPPDHRYETDLGDGKKVVNYVYKKRAVLYVALTVPPDAQPAARTIGLVVGGQVCGQNCRDVEATVSVTVTVAAQGAANPAWTPALAAGLEAAVPAAKLPALRQRQPTPAAVTPEGVADLTVWTGLGLAFLAGLILNVMPCVLPVIPLRILSLAQIAGENRRRLVTLGLAFAGGMLLFFVALAALSAAGRLATQQAFSLSGLFQFQAVRVALALVLVALAANLFGLFNVVVPSRIAGIGQGGGKQGHLSSAGMGFMMAVLATPCSFAILAQAMAWAQIMPLWLGTVAILTIGVGMATPHALLVAFPDLINKLPKPGRWMELFKQSMGFVLLPVAIWLIFAGSEDTYAGWVVAYAVLLALCLWIWGTWVRFDASLRRKLLVRGLAAAMAVGGGIWMLTPAEKPVVTMEKFSDERIAAARAENRLVLVKFTSATCLSCLVVDRTVYSDPEVARRLGEHNALVIKADTTNAAAPASKMLTRQFRGAPPLTVLFPPGGRKPIRLDGKFTKADLFKALDDAEG